MSIENKDKEIWNKKQRALGQKMGIGNKRQGIDIEDKRVWNGRRLETWITKREQEKQDEEQKLRKEIRNKRQDYKKEQILKILHKEL